MKTTSDQNSELRVVAFKAQTNSSSVGARVRQHRKSKEWTLARLSDVSGIPQSTLSKFENDTLSLPLDRIFRLSDALGLLVTDLFDNETDSSQQHAAPGRRSVSRANEGTQAMSKVYGSRWLFPDLVQKRMFPVVQNILCKEMSEFGPLIRHEGEEFSMVLKGEVLVVTDIYEPLSLKKMDGVYIDSRMGHAYLNAGKGEATILNVSTVVLDPSELSESQQS